MSIQLHTLVDPLVIAITGLVLAVLFIVRYLHLKIFIRASIYPELFIAPRGLITILLFYAIPKELQSPDFNSGILLLTIISTSLIMMLALMLGGKGSSGEDSLIDEVENSLGNDADISDTTVGPAGGV